MNGTVYLDTSSIVKRYVDEVGSELVDRIYAKAEAGTHVIIMSLWNLGEVLGVLDNYRSRKFLNDETFGKVLENLLAESEKMLRLGSMRILPLALDILVETYVLLLKHHIYQADALQIATCKVSKSNLLISADKQLLKAARAEKIEALDIETDEEAITNRFR